MKIERYHIGAPTDEMGALEQAVKQYFHVQQKQDPHFTLDVMVNGDAVSIKDFEHVKLDIAAPFYGKGSPEDCQLAAQLAVLVKRTSKEQLPRYCDKNMGLDCNGFVGNYVSCPQWKPVARDREGQRRARAKQLDGCVRGRGHPVKDLVK